MKSAIFYPPSKISVEDTPIPEIKEGEALLEVRACGICGTDLFKIKEVRKKQVLGHEISGIIKDIKGETPFSLGERVFVAHHIPCFICRYCRHGHYSLCPQFQKTNIYPGGFSQFIRIPHINLYQGTIPIPSHISFDEATLIEPFACVLRNIKRIKPHHEDKVLIIGGGPTGIMHATLLNLFGIRRIDVLEINKKRREFIGKFPINVITSESKERDYDIAIICAGNILAINEGFERLRKGGILSIFAQSPENSILKIDPNRVYFETTLIGTYSSTPIEQREIFELMKEGKLNVLPLITHTFPLSKINDAISIALKGEKSCKIIIHPQE